MRDAFEKAILDNPDESTSYAAYADWLQEQDDPRGEFMQVQLALEAGSLPKEQRKQLQARERELLDEHEREWLGELAPLLLDLDTHDTLPNVRYWWGRGFIAEMRVQHLTIQLAQTLAVAPALRFLQKLHIEVSATTEARAQSTSSRTLLDFLAETQAGSGENQPLHDPLSMLIPTPQGVRRHDAIFDLIGSPCLRNLRGFQLGKDVEPSSDGWTDCYLNSEGLEHLVASLPRVQELYLLCNGYDARALFSLPNLTHLQTLRVYGWGNIEDQDRNEVPLDALARNPALSSLTHLIVHPRYTPDASLLPLSQVHALVNSPHLASLEHLQLRLSDIGDDGVSAFIESGILKRLGWLDLRNGTISDFGAKAFAEYAPTRNLRRLDLSRNSITYAALNMLRRVGVNVVADNALSRREVERREREEREEEQAERDRRAGE
ncbi:MAG: TIGR02996 domain-containing protein [Planctomycetes bacterium]|nr:TIGR02996 domain-containing protein [Planctomycetota bacterium]